MLRLIIRQILKHKWPLLILVFIWIGAGYLLFENSHRLLATLVRLTVNLPDPGRQDPEAALGYVESARERTANIRLDLMARTCTNFLPLRYTGAIEDFRPHWLEKLESWQVSTESGPEPVEPDQYWSANIDEVLLALRDAVGAMQFAYEITAEDLGQPGAETILVPDLVARLASAACRQEIGVLAFGDYAEFQEQRAWLAIAGDQSTRSLERDDPRPVLSDLGPGERERLILEKLNGVESYNTALRTYLGGPPPDPHDRSACNNASGARHRGGPTEAAQNFRLACVAPTEAISVYDRLLAVAPAQEGPALHRDAALVHLLAARRASGAEAEAHHTAAVQHFTIASGAYETEFEARTELARLYLARAIEMESRSQADAATEAYALAHDEVRQLALLSRRRDFNETEFRELARRTLMGLGRFRDADCFADMSSLRYGTRDHCLNLQL